jgi:hypothetical protein
MSVKNPRAGALINEEATTYMYPNDNSFTAVCCTDKVTGLKRSKVVILEFTFEAKDIFAKIMEKEGLNSYPELQEMLAKKQVHSQLRKMKTLARRKSTFLQDGGNLIDANSSFGSMAGHKLVMEKNNSVIPLNVSNSMNEPG